MKNLGGDKERKDNYIDKAFIFFLIIIFTFVLYLSMAKASGILIIKIFNINVIKNDLLTSIIDLNSTLLVVRILFHFSFSISSFIMFGLLLISLKPIYYKMYGDKQILKHLIKMHEESFTSKMDSKDKTNETLIENIVSNNKIGVYDFTVIILTRCFLVFVLYSFMFGVSQLLNDILKTTIFSSIFVVFVLTLEAYPLFFRKNRQ